MIKDRLGDIPEMFIKLHPCRKMANVPKTQWAAVSTKASLMSDPPQELRPERKMKELPQVMRQSKVWDLPSRKKRRNWKDLSPSRRLTAHGNSPSAAALPPTILEELALLSADGPLMPHSIEGAGGLHCPLSRHQ